MKKLPSLTIFFPFYNDAGTVKKAISEAYYYGNKLTNDLEVITIHGGRSKDDTFSEILKQKKIHSDLIILDKTDNRDGYAVIKHGFEQASKDWVFYTDGDLQYHLDDLVKLVAAQQKTKADVVNGYKVQRADVFIRVFLGKIYQMISQHLFNLPIKDLTCDYRLIRNSFLKKITFFSDDSSILLELVIKLKNLGAIFTDVPVKHYPRIYGQSTFNLPQLVNQRLFGSIKTFLRLKKTV